MSSYCKNRSYRKTEDTQAFPDDFFSTLSLSNNKNGPRISRLICKQIKKNQNSLNRIFNREKSIEMDESYMLASPDIEREETKLPNIETRRGANTSMFVHQNKEDFCYESGENRKLESSCKRAHRYMKSEDRFRKSKNLTYGRECNLNINIKPNNSKHLSPIEKKLKFNGIDEDSFKIKPLYIECSTASNTSHSTHRPDSNNEMRDSDKISENSKFKVNILQQLCSKDDTPKTIAPFNSIKDKIQYEPIKIKVRYKNVSLNRIKLKFRKSSNKKDLNEIHIDSENRDSFCSENSNIVKNMLSNLNMSKLANYQTHDSVNKYNLVMYNSEKIKCDNFCKNENQNQSMFNMNNYLGTPRQTAYFGK